MASPTKRAGTSRFWFRMSVPARLRARVGKTEIKFSLGTNDPAVAKRLTAQHSARWLEQFRQLDTAIADESLREAPGIVRRGIAAFHPSARLDDVVFGLLKAIAFMVVTSWGPDDYRSTLAAYVFAGSPNDDEWDQEDKLADIVPKDQRAGIVARMAVLERSDRTRGMGYRDVALAVLKARRWDAIAALAWQIGEKVGVEISWPSPLFDAVAEALLHQLVEHEFETWDEASVAAFPLGAADRSIVINTSPTLISPSEPNQHSAILPASDGERPDKSHLPLSAAYQNWVTFREPGRSAQTEATRAVERFINLFGDLPIGSITVQHIFSYRDFVVRMPANISLEAVKRAGASLREVAEARLRADPQCARLAPTSVKKDLGCLHSILQSAKSERWVATNVAADIDVPGYSKKKSGKKNPRLPLTKHMMIRLFASPLFTGCAGKTDILRTRPGIYIYQDVLYWAFLFAMTTGGRLREIGQPLVTDVSVLDLGSYYGSEANGYVVELAISGNHPDQSVKNDASKRTITIHPRLIGLGFLDYVDSRKRAGEKWLFSHKQSKDGDWTKELSRRLNRYIDRTITKDPRYVFHSLRHEFEDRAENSNMSDKVTDQIQGHAPLTEGRKYGSGADTLRLSQELDKLHVDFVDWNRLMKAAGRTILIGPHRVVRSDC